MKEGWTYKKLGEVCDFEGGSQPPKSEWINHPQDGYVRMLQIRDFTKSRNAEIEYVKITKKLRLCKADDILIGRYGASVGKILTGLAGAYNVAIIKSIPDENIVRKEFIRRYFESPLFQSILFKVCTSRAAQAGFSKDDIKDELIPIPSLSEQLSIVDYLDSAFAKIDAMKANAEKALNEAKALFQASLKEMLEPKEGWEEKTLKEIVHPDCSISYGIVQPGEHIDDGVPVVRPIDFHTKIIVGAEGLKRTKREISNAYKRTILKGGELLFCVRGTTGTMGLASEELQGCNVTRGIVPLLFDNHVDKLFVYYQLLSPRLQKEIQRKTTGAALKQINIKDLRAIHLLYPPLSQQQTIVATLDSLKSKVDRLQENFDKISQECDSLKQALLRQVFE